MSFGKLKNEGEEKGPLLSTLRPTVSGATGNLDAFLGKGSKVSGVLQFSGSVELDGEVEGEIQSKDRLTIGEAAVVKAKILGADVIVKGTVSGDIYASRSLMLKKPARVIGNIQSALLTIEEGVMFEGKCSMSSSSIKDVPKQPEKVVGA